jgi:hypothetical protein
MTPSDGIASPFGYEHLQMSRTVLHNYQDPLDSIWIAAAERMNLRVNRSQDSYASTDGRGNLSISDASGMDEDDCLAQMILHEICHSLVQGPQSFGWVDWGLDNETARDREREHACLRLQAALLEPLGLRRVLAPTTDFRAYYDSLPKDPFVERDEGERLSIVLSRAAFHRRNQRPWKGHLKSALETTAQVVDLTRSYVSSDESGKELVSLFQDRVRPHQTGLEGRRAETSATCSDCAWSYEGGRGKKVLRCRQADGARVTASEPSCAHFEQPFDCLGCGACCREAYDTVEVAQNDRALKLHLPLLVQRSGGYDMGRKGSRCICLSGGLEIEACAPSISGGTAPDDAGSKLAPLAMPGEAPFTCSIYDTRPRTCREFARGSENCLNARRVVGLSR